MLSFTFGTVKVDFTGDPHLGRKFNGVPLDRVGEREASQLKQFREELMNDSDINIMVGDLFDSFLVSNEVILAVYEAYRQAVKLRPSKQFYLISGNHDISRDVEVVSSFKLIEPALNSLPNVTVAMKPMVVNTKNIDFLLMPYSEFDTAQQAIDKVQHTNYRYQFVVGHWDTIEMSGPHNQMPLETLSKIAGTVISGHEHIPYKFGITEEGKRTDKFETAPTQVYGTGSLQPYSHGEDPEGKIYVTMKLSEVEDQLARNPHYFKDKSLRILVLPGEEVPANIDCLQFAIKRVGEEKAEDMEVTIGDFDFKQLWDETFKEHNVSDELTDDYYKAYTQKANNA